jgi:hypothetical protein
VSLLSYGLPSESPVTYWVRLPLSGQFLCFVDLRGGHRPRESVSHFLSIACQPRCPRYLRGLCCRQTEPHIRAHSILGHTLPEHVHAAEHELCKWQPLVGSAAKSTLQLRHHPAQQSHRVDTLHREHTERGRCRPERRHEGAATVWMPRSRVARMQFRPLEQRALSRTSPSLGTQVIKREHSNSIASRDGLACPLTTDGTASGHG